MNKSLLDFKLYPTFDKNEDEFDYLQYRDLFFMHEDKYYEFHAGKRFVDWSEIEKVFGSTYDKNIIIYQGDFYTGKYEKFATLNIWRCDFILNRPKKTSSTPSIKNKDNPIKWNKLTCSKYKVNKLPNGKFEILYY